MLICVGDFFKYPVSSISRFWQCDFAHPRDFKECLDRIKSLVKGKFWTNNPLIVEGMIGKKIDGGAT